MDKSFEQFSAWWETASRTLKCDKYEAFEIWQEASKFSKSNEIPDGWVLVPKEPTEAMVVASFCHRHAGDDYCIADIYKAMIEAVVVKGCENV